MPVLDISAVYQTPVFTLNTRTTAVKEVFGAVYHGPTGQWRFPAFFPVYERVLSDLNKVMPGVALSAAAEEYLADIAKPASLPEEFSFITKPYQHQLDGLLHLYKYLRAGLFYSPGLGKCKITVDLQRLTQDRFLILCPRVMLSTWAEEFVKHGNKTDVFVVDGLKKHKLDIINKAATTNFTAVIATYGVATLYSDLLLKIPYTGIVADESHQLKSPFAKRTKAAIALASRAYRRILLSGTPSLGSPFDLYGQLRFLGKYFCPEDWWKFRKMFGVFPPHEANEKVPKMLLGYKNVDLMNRRVNYVCLRKTKEECLDLPAQVIIDQPFSLYPEQKRVYNEFITERCDAYGANIKTAIEEGALSHADGTTLPEHCIMSEPITLLGKLDQVSSGFVYKTTTNPQLCNGCEHVHVCSKNEVRPYTKGCKVVQHSPAPVVTLLKKNARLEECQGILETILEDSENKVIIWANFRTELDHIEGMCKEAKIGYVRVEGGASQQYLKTCMDTFNTSASCRVYIGQVSTGIGITLNAANYTIYYNLPWSLEHYQQSLDRNYRIGQKRKVTVYRLIGKHTLDEAKAAAMDQKIDFSWLITTKHICATCPEFSRRCARYKVEPYEDDCIYDRTVLRETAQVRLIP